MANLTKVQIDDLISRLHDLRQATVDDVKGRLCDEQLQQIALVNHFAQGDEKSDAINLSDIDIASLVRDVDHIVTIDEAIKRLRSESAGMCSKCGQLILWPRLDANPLAPTCLRCQIQMECRQTPTIRNHS